LCGKEKPMKIDRRDFLKLAGLGCAVFASGLGGLDRSANRAFAADGDFFFVQLSDTHWGFTGPQVNPDATGTLKKAIAAVNGLKPQPDFIVFTGDLTHTTDDDKERRKRIAEFRHIAGGLTNKRVRFLPGEHDAGLDQGEAYREILGDTHYTFDHKGIHFIVLDNVSDPGSKLGDQQLKWLGEDLKKLGEDTPIVVLTHRPLFDLYPEWDWHTRDGSKAIELLTPYSNVTVFYGHIHQEHHHKTGQIQHHAAKGLMYPLPAPGSVPKKAPVLWNDAKPYNGLGFRAIRATGARLSITEFGVKGDKL
jgi:hypothetical protein